MFQTKSPDQYSYEERGIFKRKNTAIDIRKWAQYKNPHKATEFLSDNKGENFENLESEKTDPQLQMKQQRP